MLATVLAGFAPVVMSGCGDDDDEGSKDAGPDGSADGESGGRGGRGGSAGRNAPRRDSGSETDENPATDPDEPGASSGSAGKEAPNEPSTEPGSEPGAPPASDDDAGVDATPGSLKTAATTAKKQIGAIVSSATLAADAEYATVLAREFTSVTARNLNWGVLQSLRGQWWFEESDAVVNAATVANQTVHAETLFAGENPAWVAALTPAELQVELQRHVDTVVGHFKGKVKSYTVLSGALDPVTNAIQPGLYTTLGIPGLAQLFTWIKAADPDALLYYSDEGISDAGARADAALKFVQDLKTAGAPIDGVLFNLGVSTSGYATEAALRANLKRFAEVVPNVAYSELVVVTKAGDPGGTAARRFAAQSLAYQLIAGVCATEPACRGVTTYGFTDKDTWVTGDDPLPFDAKYAPKAAYDGLVQGFSGKVPAVSGDELISNGDFEMPAQIVWNAFGGGVLTVQTEIASAGSAAALTTRTMEYEGVGQSLLAKKISADGLCVTAQVRVDAPTAPVTLNIKLAPSGPDPEGYRVVNSVTANNTGWVTLEGCTALYTDAATTDLTLYISGPPTGVSLYVDNVSAKVLK